MPRFSPTLMDHFQDPRNQGTLERPDRTGIAGTPGVGQFLVLYLQLEGDSVVDARFQSHGCGVTIACGSALTELIRGKSLSDLRGIDAALLNEALEGVPGDKQHCLQLAVSALHSVLQGD